MKKKFHADPNLRWVQRILCLFCHVAINYCCVISGALRLFSEAGFASAYVDEVGVCTWCKYNPLAHANNNHILDHILTKGLAVQSARVRTFFSLCFHNCCIILDKCDCSILSLLCINMIFHKKFRILYLSHISQYQPEGWLSKLHPLLCRK